MMGELLADDRFDRSRAEAEAAHHGETLSEVRGSLVDALERVHAILTPEQ